MTVYLVYRIGRLSFGTTAALLAAAFLAVNVLHADLSHYVTVDVPMVCLAVAALYFAIRMATGGTARDYSWAAPLAALATSTKIPAVLLLLPLLIAHCYFVKDRGTGVRGLVLGRELWQAVAIFVIAYAIATPGIVVYYQSTLGFFLGASGMEPDLDGEVIAGIASTEPTREQLTLFEFYFEKIYSAMSLPLFVVCTTGVAYGTWKHQRADVILIQFALITFVVVSSTADEHAFLPRYILPIVPVLVLMGRRMLGDLLRLLSLEL